MELLGFDHVNVRTSRLDEMVRWYGEILGMRSGPRPPFPFPGAWLYLGDAAIIHLVGVAAHPAGEQPRLEHFAIRARGLAATLAMVKERGLAHDIATVPGFGIIQINLWDPDGNHLHLDFSPDEKAALDAG